MIVEVPCKHQSHFNVHSNMHTAHRSSVSSAVHGWYKTARAGHLNFSLSLPFDKWKHRASVSSFFFCWCSSIRLRASTTQEHWPVVNAKLVSNTVVQSLPSSASLWVDFASDDVNKNLQALFSCPKKWRLKSKKRIFHLEQPSQQDDRQRGVKFYWMCIWT